MRICPNCGGNQFISHGHVVQEWLVNESGLCIDVTNECVCVTHEPDDKDIWKCVKCGHEGAGKEFYVNEIQIESR